ncbi:hypothetical protein BB561_002481 [Smittium simulii]|uniref:Rap-GAP domain-containing protein n=1 Tax=Smittium simulii TaxID=133385 RepID=A0A2T9YQB2_9FUNG|nr:hypothetical protein BB561_002481 [Smittium simulii]
MPKNNTELENAPTELSTHSFPTAYTSLLQDVTFTEAAASCCYLSNLPPLLLEYPTEPFINKINEMCKGKKSTPQNWFHLKTKNSSRISYLLNHLSSLSDNQLLYVVVYHHEVIFDIAFKAISKIVLNVQNSSNIYVFSLTDIIKSFLEATEIIKSLFFFVPKKFSDGWKQLEVISILSTILDHGNNPEFRIYGFRLLLLYMNSLMGKFTETIVDLFKNSIILQSFVEEDLFKSIFSTDQIIDSLHSTPESVNYEFKQSSIKSNLLQSKSIYPINNISTDYYMSLQSITSTRMVQEFFHNVLFMSNFVLDEHNCSELDDITRYFSGPDINLLYTPSNDSINLPFKLSKNSKSSSVYDKVSVYLMNSEDADISLNSTIGLFITNYVLYFIQSKEVTQGLGGVPIPLMKTITSFLLKYVAYNGKLLNNITGYINNPQSGNNLNVFSPYPSKANDFVYSEKMRRYQQYIWLESNKSLSIFTESVIFGVLRIDKSIICSSGYNPATTENIYQDITDTQVAALNIFRIFMEMDTSKRPAQLVKPIESGSVPKWVSLMLKYLTPTLNIMQATASSKEPYNFSKFTVFYLSVLVFRSIFSLPTSEMPIEIKDNILSSLFEVLEVMLNRPIMHGETPTDPYCLAAQAIMLLFEFIVEAWLLTIIDKSKYWVKFEKIFFIESGWTTRYHVWANVLQSLTITMGTKMYDIDDLELLQDYMFSGQRTKGGNRGLIRKIEAIQRNHYVAIKHGNRIENPFLPQTPFIITSKCSLIASQIVLDYLNKKRKLRDNDFNYVLNTIKNNTSELDISEFLHSADPNNAQALEKKDTNSGVLDLDKNINIIETGLQTDNHYSLDSYISVISIPPHKYSAIEPSILQSKLKEREKKNNNGVKNYSSIFKTQSVPYQPNPNDYNGSKNQYGLSNDNSPITEPNKHDSIYSISNISSNIEINKLTKTYSTDNIYNSDYLATKINTVKHKKNHRDVSLRSGFLSSNSLSLSAFESKNSIFSLKLNMNIKDKFKNMLIRKKSLSALNSLATKLKFVKRKTELMRFDGSETLETFRDKETLRQLEHSVNIIEDRFNEWILIKTPFIKPFDLNTDLPWSQISITTQIDEIWQKWWQLVEKPLNIRNFEAKKIVTMGLSRAWDIKLVLIDRQTATGISSKTDKKLAFAHWLFELCKGPKDSDDCSIIAIRAISRVFCRSFSPNYSIPPMYQALFYRLLLESLSGKALEFGYGQRLLEVTLTECNRIFALDVPGCFMVVKSLVTCLQRIFSIDFAFQLKDDAINGAVILLISCITVLFSSNPSAFDNIKISPIVTYNLNSESVVEWMPFDLQKKIEQLCFLMLKLSGEHNQILKNVSNKIHTKINCNLVGSLSIIVMMNRSSREGITENAINIILANLFETNKQYVFVAMDSLRVFISYNSTKKIVDLLGLELIFLICKTLAYSCYEQLDRFIDTGDSHFTRMFSDMLNLLMSYIILVPSVISGQGSTINFAKHKKFSKFLFNDLLQVKVNDLFKQFRPLSLHKYNHSLIMSVSSPKKKSLNPTNIKTRLEKAVFVESSEYTGIKKPYSLQDSSVALKWIKQCVLVFSFQLMHHYNNYVPIQEFERYLNDSNSAGDDLENISNGDELMFFGYGNSIISVIKPAGKTQLKLTVRSTVGKYTGYIQSTLEGESLKQAIKIQPTTLTNKEVANFLKSNSDFSLKKFIVDQKNLEDEEISKVFDQENTDDKEFDLPKVRFINSYDVDWVNYKTLPTNEFGSENEKIERLVSNTKDFVFSYKNKEENALLKLPNVNSELIKETINNKNPVFRELRLFLHHFGLFDWTKNEPTPFKLLLPSNTLFKDLSLLDKLTSKESIKVAICYVAPNQTTESEILSNSIESTSLAYREFVRSLGWPVELKNFGGYTGKLNTNGSDGKIAPFYVTNSLELVFHDSTEMPTDKADPKQLKKKRHIGNDYVHIIWNENFCDYRPETITGDFGNAQIHIRPLLSNLGNYGVSFFVDQRIDSIGPLVENMIIGPDILGHVVRSWVISAHRQTLWMRSPAFYSPPLVRIDNITQIISKNIAPDWAESSSPGSFLINPGNVSTNSQHSSYMILDKHKTSKLNSLKSISTPLSNDISDTADITDKIKIESNNNTPQALPNTKSPESISSEQNSNNNGSIKNTDSDNTNTQTRKKNISLGYFNNDDD